MGKLPSVDWDDKTTATPLADLLALKEKGFDPAVGGRADHGKPRVDLIPPEVLLELGKLYAYGAAKYEENNWLKGMDYTRMLASLKRHLFAFESGQTTDLENGLHHLVAVIWNAVGLLHYEMNPSLYSSFDNRPYTMKNNTDIAMSVKKEVQSD